MQAIRNFVTPSYESNIPKFFVFRAIYNFMLFLPVWMIFLKEEHGLSLTESTLLNSAFWLTMVLTEIPTGAVADTIGRKHSQVIGMALVAGSLLLFGLAPNYPLLILANSLWTGPVRSRYGNAVGSFRRYERRSSGTWLRSLSTQAASMVPSGSSRGSGMASTMLWTDGVLMGP